MPELPNGVGSGTEGIGWIKPSAEPAVHGDHMKQNKGQHDHGGDSLQPLAQVAAVMMFLDAEFQPLVPQCSQTEGDVNAQGQEY
jgi:hypothetical protein